MMPVVLRLARLPHTHRKFCIILESIGCTRLYPHCIISVVFSSVQSRRPSRTGETESERPCTVSLHFLKLLGDLVASVRAILAARAGSLALLASFSGCFEVSISDRSAHI